MSAVPVVDALDVADHFRDFLVPVVVGNT
jgi:hypothetical protein